MRALYPVLARAGCRILALPRRRGELSIRAARGDARRMTDPEDTRSISEPPTPREPRVHLVVGPVGAGKSTHAAALAASERAVRLTLDEWMAELFRPDRPEVGVMAWYVERAARCVEQIWRLALEILRADRSVVLEIGLLQRGAREAFYARVDAAGFELVLHVIDAPRDVRRARVMRRNEERGATFSMVVPMEMFELASDLWEPPDADERALRCQPFLRST